MADTSIADNGPLHFQPEWCRVTLASIGDAVITTDTFGRVTFLNPVAEALTGWRQDEAAGVVLESVFKIINQVTRHPVESPTVRALRDGVVVGLANHTLLIGKDGTERPIDDSAAPIRNDKNEVAGVVLVFRDITERYAQELRIQDALNYADNIIATVRESLVVLDESLCVVTTNRTFCEAFKVSAEQTRGVNLFALVDREWDIPSLRRQLEEILPHNTSFEDFRVEHTFPVLGKRMLLLNARPFVPMDGARELILLAIEDVTDRVRAEQRMKENELRYRRLFETAKDGILILSSASGKIIDANPFITDLLGYSHGELLGKELWEIGVFADIAASRAAVLHLQTEGYIRYSHLPLETSVGHQVDVEFVSNVYQVDGESVIQCNIRDLTARRQLEEARIREEVSADLHRRKDEFLAMLSHELRNPLAPIQNAVHLLRLQNNEKPVQRQAREMIERQVGQLKHLVDDLLEVSRITTGRVQLRTERIDIRGVVDRAVETVRPLLDGRRHAVTITQSDEPIWVNGDPTRLEQVVVNLLGNAAKYTDEGGQVQLTNLQEGEVCVIRVRDTGVGISPELLPRIFDLFTQSERSLARSEGGLGIGLTVVQRFVEMHGGHVEAYSSLGYGSEFVIRLPILGEDSSAGNPETEASIGDEASGAQVMVVDDNRDTADSLAGLLAAYGYEVRTAYDGLEGVATAIAFAPAVVICDIGLPALNGYDVARRIRALPGHADTLLIAITGYGQGADRQLARDAGFNHHLVKPAEIETILDLIKAFVKGRK